MPTPRPATTAVRSIPLRLSWPLASTSAPMVSILSAKSPIWPPTSGRPPTTPSAWPVSLTAVPTLITSVLSCAWALMSLQISTPSTIHTTIQTTTPTSSQRTERALRSCDSAPMVPPGRRAYSTRCRDGGGRAGARGAAPRGRCAMLAPIGR